MLNVRGQELLAASLYGFWILLAPSLVLLPRMFFVLQVVGVPEVVSAFGIILLLVASEVFCVLFAPRLASCRSACFALRVMAVFAAFGPGEIFERLGFTALCTLLLFWHNKTLLITGAVVAETYSGDVDPPVTRSVLRATILVVCKQI
jgi:hypothetical protein